MERRPAPVRLERNRDAKFPLECERLRIKTKGFGHRPGVAPGKGIDQNRFERKGLFNLITQILKMNLSGEVRAGHVSAPGRDFCNPWHGSLTQTFHVGIIHRHRSLDSTGLPFGSKRQCAGDIHLVSPAGHKTSRFHGKSKFTSLLASGWPLTYSAISCPRANQT